MLSRENEDFRRNPSGTTHDGVLPDLGGQTVRVWTASLAHDDPEHQRGNKWPLFHRTRAGNKAGVLGRARRRRGRQDPVSRWMLEARPAQHFPSAPSCLLRYRLMWKECEAGSWMWTVSRAAYKGGERGRFSGVQTWGGVGASGKMDLIMSTPYLPFGRFCCQNPLKFCFDKG